MQWKCSGLRRSGLPSGSIWFGEDFWSPCMATPYKRKGSKPYWADIWYGGKKRSISLRTDNLGVARSMLHQKLAVLREGGLQLPTRTPTGEILEKFVQHLRANGRLKSAQTDVYRLREFFGGVCPGLEANSCASSGQIAAAQRRGCSNTKGKKVFKLAVQVHFIEEVTTAMASDFLTAIRTARQLDPKTVNEYREILFRFFKWAIDHQGVRMPSGVRTNPIASIKRLRTQEPVIRFLKSMDDIRHQLAVLEKHRQVQTMVAVLIYAGLRRSEMLHLTPADVDIAERRIYVRSKQIPGAVYHTKTGRNRFVPISNALMTYLVGYRRPARSPWSFPSPSGGLWDADNFSHQLADINRKAGLVWNCLDYRHTFGSHLAMRGESLFKVAELMGNSPEICRRHYVCLLPQSLVGCVEFDSSVYPTPASVVRKPHDTYSEASGYDHDPTVTQRMNASG